MLCGNVPVLWTPGLMGLHVSCLFRLTIQLSLYSITGNSGGSCLDDLLSYIVTSRMSCAPWVIRIIYGHGTPDVDTAPMS